MSFTDYSKFGFDKPYTPAKKTASETLIGKGSPKIITILFSFGVR